MPALKHGGCRVVACPTVTIDSLRGRRNGLRRLGRGDCVGGAGCKPVCPAAFTAQTLDDALVRYAGAYTEEEIRDGFAFHDVDGNGIVCGKPFQKDRYYPLQNLRDDLTGRAVIPPNSA